MAIIELDGVTREFALRDTLLGKRRVVRAVDGMSFSLEPGTAVGYIGANGSGKSTTIKMITGILTPSAGRLRVCGLDPVPQRRRLAGHLGVLFGQRSLLWWDLPLRESYPILAAMHRQAPARWKPRFDELVDGLGLEEFLTTPVRNLSLGQRMRGELAAALLHRPELVVLDEPTIGLDMLSKERLRTFLDRERVEHGTSLLLTTHDMGDVQRLCQRMLVIDRGRLVFDGSQPELERETGAERVLVVDAADDIRADQLSLPPGVRVAEDDEAVESRVRLAFPAEQISAAALITAVSAQVEVVDLALTEPDVEDLVRRIYQRGDEE
ncbi:ABC transporter ATP-binding protein [Parenemella sanctibonifatiensis]|uniref:Methionine ABC transporter ATP-binding protein n=1 Tax=Parenemella sanctibonifatiensis TaxID=2016505 RepID=A0A255EHT6_9ACTN|nr:ATP-binding cassette domain-containing protein [Parenemella sanctibonifatiensis]OYN90810.1 methionine ABC transporter ATP-binding protein [Parenemella sanctibonifatiensis]